MANTGVRPAVPAPTGHPADAVASVESDAAVLQAAKRRLGDYKALAERAADVFGDQMIASRWLSSPSVDFAGRTPIQDAMEHDYSPEYVERVFEPIFIVIEHGIYT